MKKVLKSKKANTRKYKDKQVGKMFNETRTLLNNFYGFYNRKLSHLLNDKKYLWDSANLNSKKRTDNDEYHYEDE